ncbi:hypothetical protein [Streptomyces pseudovenezuelae]|uniref:hypothetical protein n=1 Tax=Streptomyces pseudovenezuelae TaxID=67350 RepID=UPI002E823424|nr:hypothetical protein [Streptomyces pseudovenezuelae]WUA94421.1 hypothetical protein OHO81_45090 [Streptomyces pseudovenezuelae]
MTNTTYTAHYWRHHVKDSEEFPSLDQAVGFLANGWADADLSQISVIAPDGSVALDGQELLDAMQTHLHG